VRFWKLVGVEQAQWRRTFVLWALLFFMTIAFELSSDTIKALFLNQIGSKALPPAFVLEAALRLGATVFYFVLLRRRSYGQVMLFTILTYVMTVFVLMTVMASADGGSLTLFYAIERVAYKLIMLHWGVYIVDFFTVGESSTSFPVIYSAQPSGSVLAGLLLAFNPFAEVEYLFVVALGALGVAICVLKVATRVAADSPRVSVNAPGRDDGGTPDWKATWIYLWRAPVVRYMALATFGLVIVRAMLQVSAAHVLENEFSSARRISHFLGYYKIWSNLFVFSLQAFLSARIMKWFSPTRVNFSYAVFTLVGFGLLFLFPGTGSLIFSESVRKEWKSVLKTPFSVMMYGTMADYARAGSRIAIFGVIVPVSGILAGLLMMGLARMELSSAHLAGPGMLVAVLFLGVSGLQNRAYKLALVALLQDKLQSSTGGRTTSTLMRVPDARILDIRKIRHRPDYAFMRGQYARRLFPESFESLDELAPLGDQELLERLDEMLLLVELYRPKGAPQLRNLLVLALTDRRNDLSDNALEVANSILPPRLAKRARRLLREGLDRGVELH
jgi:hypothetical protein